jgi:hypothetical protein
MLLRSFTPSEDEVDEFANEASLDVVPSAITRGITNDPFSALMGIRLSGVPDVLDIAGAALDAVLDDAELELNLEFFHEDPSRSDLPPRVVSTRTGLPVEEAEESAVTRANPKPPGVKLFGWSFRFRPVHSHPLGSCVKTPIEVKHFHIDVQHRRPNGSYRKVMDVHLGTYRQSGKRCFVMYENELLDKKGRPKNTCWKRCSPTLSDLVEMLAWVIAAAAVVAGVAVAGWTLAAIAAAVAAVLFVPLKGLV